MGSLVPGMNTSRRPAMAPGISIIIPAYNEEKRIGTSLNRLFSYLDCSSIDAEVIVVDDGSTDGTAAAVAAMKKRFPRLLLERNGVNRGKGYSVKQGVRQSQGRFILFTDADLSTPPEEIGRFLVLLEQGWDVVVGSRDLDPRLLERPQPWFRRWAGQAFHWLVWALIGLPVRDTQCGFKGFHRSAALSLFGLQQIERFGFDVEILWLAHRLGFRCLEEAVIWRNDTASRVSLLRDGPAMVMELLKIVWRSWRNKELSFTDGRSRPSSSTDMLVSDVPGRFQ